MIDRHIASIRKNAREEIRVALRDFKGRRAIDLRIHQLSPRQDDRTAMEPTPKGLVVRLDQLRAVINGLQQAEAAAREEGLIDPAE